MLSDAELIALIPKWREEATGRSASSFVRWCRRHGIKLGASRAARIIGMARSMVPVQHREWEALGRDGEIVKLHHTTYKVKADELAALEEMASAVIKPAPPAQPHKGSGNLLVLSLPDQHVGKLAWGKETGDDYDIGIAVDMYMSAVAHLVSATAHYEPSKVLYIVGNDLVHIDNSSNTTTAGTPQDVDSRWPKVVGAAFKMVASTVETIAERANVDVVIAPGNHDTHTTYMIGFALAQRYRDDKRIQVINKPSYRQYYREGKLLFGITHGDGIKEDRLPLIMATEQPKDWGEVRWREWFLGHFHRRKALQMVNVNDELGVLITRLPSLTGVDSWHFKHGFGGLRHAEARVYDPATGVLIGTAVHVL